MQIELNDGETRLIRAALDMYRTDAHETLTYMRQPNARDRNGDTPRKAHIDRAVATIERLDALRGRFE